MPACLPRKTERYREPGVGEALNETANGEGLIARGRHWLFYSDTYSYHIHRDIGLDLFYKPTVVIGNEGGLEVRAYVSISFLKSGIRDLLQYKVKQFLL